MNADQFEQQGTNQYEQRARILKATTLARWFYREMLDTVRRLDDDGWAQVCELAGVKQASAETRVAVFDVLRGKEPKGAE